MYKKVWTVKSQSININIVQAQEKLTTEETETETKTKNKPTRIPPARVARPPRQKQNKQHTHTERGQAQHKQKESMPALLKTLKFSQARVELVKMLDKL